MNEDLIDLLLNGKRTGAIIHHRYGTELDDRINNDNFMKVSSGYYYKKSNLIEFIAVTPESTKFNEVVKYKDIRDYLKYPFFKSLLKLYKMEESNYAADTLSFVASISKFMPSPELSVIEGLLLGYKPCCVNYYVCTRFFDEKKHLFDQPELFLKDLNENNHILCLNCALDTIRKNK